MASILVEILGNAKQFKSELDGAVASTEKANTGFGKMQKVAGVAGLAIAGGLAVGLDKSVEAAIEAQQAHARLDASFSAAGLSAGKYQDAITKAEVAGRSLGFTDEQTQGAIGNFVTATGNASTSLKDLGVAQDLARFKHISLADASKIITSAMAGSQRAARQLGITLPPVTTAQDALKASGSKLKEEIFQQQLAVQKLTGEHDKSKEGVARLKDAQALLSLEQNRAKESTLDNASAAGKAEQAHAKYLDKLATGQSVIDEVTKRVKGQSKAFSDTAAGGIAQFHAQMQNVEEQLGKVLLPVMTSVAQEIGKLSKFFSDHTEVAKLLVIGLGALAGVLGAIAVATKLASAAQTIAAAATKVWTAGQWLLNAALDANPIGLVVIAIAALAAGLVLAWQHSATFRSIVKGAFDDVKSAAQTVADFFTKTLPAAFGAVVSWVRSNWPVIATLISGPFAPIVALATNAFGIRSALTGAFTSIKNTVTGILGGLVNDVTGLAKSIGESLVNGIIDGVGGLYDALKNKLEGTLHSVVSNLNPFSTVREGGSEHIGVPLAEGVIDGWVLGVAQLPQKISQSLQNAVQAGQRVVQAAQTTFQTAWQQLAGDADTAFRGITGAIQTPAEKTLSKLQDAHDAAQRTQALTDAQTQLATAQAGGDPAAIAQAQQAVADAQYTIQVAALQKQAALQRTQLDARNALQQRNFDAALGALQDHLAKAHSSYADAHTAILKLFKSFGIHYQNAGTDLGNAFITGLKESIQKAAKGAGALSGTLTDVASGIHVPHAATGGVVSQTGLAVIHQGETITPDGGGGTVNITVNGWVGSDQAIAEKLRNELIRLGRNTSGGVLGGFA